MPETIINHRRIVRDGRRIAHIESTISGLKVEIGNLSQGFTSLSNEIRNIAEKSQASARPNYGVMAAWVGVSLSWMVFYSGLLLDPLKIQMSDQQRRVLSLEEVLQKQRIKAARAEERDLITNKFMEEKLKDLDSEKGKRE